MKTLPSEREHLERAIAALESQREELGDAVVDAALAQLGSKVAELRAHEPVPRQERRLATMLLADISGSTALSETMDAEEIGDLLNEIWRRVDGVIDCHGGDIDKHIGDAVLAIWGSRHAREDDPERAVRAALAIQESLETYRAERRIPVAMRVAVNTGPVLLGRVGTTGESTVVGRAVNITERLQKSAPSGAVVISQATYDHVRGVFDLLPQAPIAARGCRAPLTSYLVVRARPRARRAEPRGVEGIETRMVGRDAALFMLQDQLAEVARGAGGRIVTISGDAGIGKSRLLHEFERWLDAQPLDVQRFEGRATPAMRSVPFALLRDLVACGFDILETDSPDAVRQKLRTGTARALAPEEADVLGHWIGFDLSASAAVSKLLGSPSFGAIARGHFVCYLRALAARTTLVVVEDGHWSDDDSLDLLADTVDGTPEARLLVACLARPQLFEHRQDWGRPGRKRSEPRDALTGRHSRIHIRLDPLSRSECSALLDDILRKARMVPDSLRDLVIREAEGNPYYLEEIVKRLIEDDVIVAGPRSWRVRSDRLTRVTVPTTLTGVLQARLDSLPSADRNVLRLASIVGRTFWDAAVIELAAGEIPSTEVRRALGALCGRELIFRRRASAFSGATEYMFKHAILRDVTYDTVLLKERRRAHCDVARWLERVAEDRLSEYLDVVAAHYEAGGDNVAAAVRLARRAEELRRKSAYRDAIATGTRTLALVSPAERAIRASVLAIMGQANRQMGAYDDAKKQFSEGLAESRGAGLTESEIAALNGLGLVARVQGDARLAREYLDQALAVATRVNDLRGMAHSLYNLGDVAYRSGDADGAADYATRSLAIFGRIGDRQGMAYALRVLGFAAQLRGDFEASDGYHTASQSIYEEMGDRWGVAACLINRGESARRRNDFATAIRHNVDALRIATETGAAYEIVICNNNLGHAYLAAGHPREAEQCLSRAIEGGLSLGALPVVLEALVGAALLAHENRRFVESAMLVGFVQNHPACCDEVLHYVRPLEAALRADLLPAELESALADGAARSIYEMLGTALPPASVTPGAGPAG